VAGRLGYTSDDAPTSCGEAVNVTTDDDEEVEDSGKAAVEEVLAIGAVLGVEQ